MLVKPKNNVQLVQKFFDLFAETNDKVNADVVLSIGEISVDMPVPFALQKPISLNTLVKQYWDLNVSSIFIPFLGEKYNFI